MLILIEILQLFLSVRILTAPQALPVSWDELLLDPFLVRDPACAQGWLLSVSRQSKEKRFGQASMAEHKSIPRHMKWAEKAKRLLICKNFIKTRSVCDPMDNIFLADTLGERRFFYGRNRLLATKK